MKKPEEMTDHELMIELLKSQQQDTKNQRLTAIGSLLLVLVFAVAFAIMIPKAVTTLQQVGSTLTQVESTLTEVERTVVQAQGSLTEIDQMVGNVNGLVVDNTEQLSASIQQISEIDIEGLNRSIEDLSSVIGPLASLFRR